MLSPAQSIFARRAALAASPGALEKARARCVRKLSARAPARLLLPRSRAVTPPSASACSGCSVLTSPYPGFEAAFNTIWADNADALSQLYTGTGAQKTDFTRTGRRTALGAATDLWISLSRWVLNNLSDGRTQDAWDLFLGRFIPRKLLPEDAKALPGTPGGAKGSRTQTPAAAHAAGPSPVSPALGRCFMIIPSREPHILLFSILLPVLVLRARGRILRDYRAPGCVRVSAPGSPPPACAYPSAVGCGCRSRAVGAGSVRLHQPW